MRRRLIRRLAGICCVILALMTTPASAQVFLGSIDVTALDITGAVLPGASVEVTGPQDFFAVTDSQGEAHFLNLAVGTYGVRVARDAFRDYLSKNVPVVASGVVW